MLFYFHRVPLFCCWYCELTNLLPILWTQESCLKHHCIYFFHSVSKRGSIHSPVKERKAPLHLYTAPPPGPTLKQIADLLAAGLTTAPACHPVVTTPVVVKVEDLHGVEFIPVRSLHVITRLKVDFLLMVNIFLFAMNGPIVTLETVANTFSFLIH